MLTSSVSLIAETQGSQLQRQDERWVRGTLTLEHEYGVKARIVPSRYQVARWITCDEKDGGAKELQRFIDGNAHRVAYDAVDAPTVLVEYAPELRAIEANWPKIRFHALREHAGLVFQRQLEG